jgi:hypothetical protein
MNADAHIGIGEAQASFWFASDGSAVSESLLTALPVRMCGRSSDKFRGKSRWKTESRDLSAKATV